MYIITITEIKTVTKLVKGEHTVIGQTPSTKADQNNSYGQDLPPMKNVYGYAGDRERDVEVKTDILSQTVQELDLTSVIKAINGIP